MNTGGGTGPKKVLCEINVTPLVDVMLVLLIIFMVAAGVQTVEMHAEQQKTLEEAERILDEAFAVKAPPKHQKVGVDLPRVNSEAVNLHEVKKLKLQITHELVFSLSDVDKDRVLVRCLDISPAMQDFLTPPLDDEVAKVEQAAFAPCLKALGEKLVDNQKLRNDKELYVLADRRLDYGKVLRVMAVIRQAGVTRFGLVAEPGLLGDAKVEREPEITP
jgi:biopolymer transport protein ExbD